VLGLPLHHELARLGAALLPPPQERREALRLAYALGQALEPRQFLAPALRKRARLAQALLDQRRLAINESARWGSNTCALQSRALASSASVCRSSFLHWRLAARVTALAVAMLLCFSTRDIACRSFSHHLRSMKLYPTLLP
jgi:hypothetical protein